MSVVANRKKQLAVNIFQKPERALSWCLRKVRKCKVIFDSLESGLSLKKSTTVDFKDLLEGGRRKYLMQHCNSAQLMQNLIVKVGGMYCVSKTKLSPFYIRKLVFNSVS